MAAVERMKGLLGAAALVLAVTAAESPEPKASARDPLPAPASSPGTSGPGGVVTTDSLRVLLDQLHYDAAEREARGLLAHLQSTAPPDTVMARVLDLLVEARWRLGRSAGSETDSLSARAVALRDSLFGPQSPEVARSLLARALILDNAGRHEAARPHAERALAILEAAFGPEHARTAQAINMLATLDLSAGRYPEAVAGFRRSLAILQRERSPESGFTGQLFHNLGMAHRAMGDYVQAQADYQQALAIREKVLGPQHPQVAWTLNNLANVVNELGDFATVERLRRRALKIFEQALGPDHPDVAFAMVNLANVLVTRGDSTLALPMYQRALAVQEAVLGPENYNLARTLNNLAPLVAARGDLKAAQEMYRRSAAIRERAFGPTHPEVAFTLVRLAQVYEQAGDDSLALQTQERALRVRMMGLGPDHPLTGEVLSQHAYTLARTGHDSLALAEALRADDIAIRHFRLTVRTLDERAAALYADYRMSSRDVALTLAAQRARTIPAVDSLAWDALVRARALVLDELAARHRSIAESGDPEVERRAGEVAAAKARLAELVMGGGDAQDSTEHARLLEEARADEERAERALAQHSARFRAADQARRVGLAEVLAALPPGFALVSYAYFEPVTAWPRRPDGSRVWQPAPSRVLAFVGRSGSGAVHVVDLGPADSLETLAIRWAQRAMRRPAPAQRARTDRAYDVAGQALRGRAWDPVAEHLAGVRHVLLVPDGALHLVNFAALPTSSGKFLIEQGPALHLLSAERDVVHFATAHSTGHGLAVFGAATFDGPVQPNAPRGGDAFARDPLSDCLDFKALRFGPLPATAREAEEVGALWRSTPRLAPSDSVVLRTGDAATEAELKRLAPGRRVLHLASHGFFLPARCPQVKPGAPLENPLLRAGLALAGANRRSAAPAEGDDGIVTAEEIAGLDLDAVDWAVLSACRTGAGDPKVGEGVLGMRRAFQVAGARTVVMNLWSVDDEIARRFMGLLYQERWVRGLDTMSAMREAALQLISERRAAGRSTHPYYWASFVAAGDWR